LGEPVGRVCWLGEQGWGGAWKGRVVVHCVGDFLCCKLSASINPFWFGGGSGNTFRNI
jgi:hypothetical protein